jgi:hypothetical protein
MAITTIGDIVTSNRVWPFRTRQRNYTQDLRPAPLPARAAVACSYFTSSGGA